MKYSMPLTHEQCRLLEHSVSAVQPHAEALSDFFYAHLLENLPSLAPAISLNRKSQQKQLLEALNITICHAFSGYSYVENDPHAGMWNLGQRTLTPMAYTCYYEAAGHAIVYAFRQVLKDDFSDALHTVWQIMLQSAAYIATLGADAPEQATPDAHSAS